MLFIVLDGDGLAITDPNPFAGNSLTAAIKKIENDFFLPSFGYEAKRVVRSYQLVVERPAGLTDNFYLGEYLLLGYADYPDTVLDWEEPQVLEWIDDNPAAHKVKIRFHMIDITVYPEGLSEGVKYSS